MDYIRMDIDDALKLRWERGVEAHRGGNANAEWAGQPPLVECYEEFLDSIHYCREAAKRGDLTELQAIHLEEQIRELATQVQLAAQWEPEPTPDPPPKNTPPCPNCSASLEDSRCRRTCKCGYFEDCSNLL